MRKNKLTIVLPDVKNVTFGDLDLSKLSEFGDVITYPISAINELQDRIKDADIVLCNKTLLNQDTLNKAFKLKYIGLFATGYNNVDLNYTNSHGITVCNAGSYSTDSVAQHTFGLILNHYNKISKYNEFVQNNGWKNSETFSPFIYGMNELSGKTIGIIGFGSIGQKVARIALAFNMNVIAYSRNINKVKDIIVEEFQDKRNISYGSINDICLKSDIITLHCPLNSESERMINKDFLNNCKKTCFLVNTARGGLIDENALLNALNNEVIEGAGIDALTEEPMLFNCSLVGAKNITITPHIAWAPLETRQRLLEIVINNLRKYLEGKPINVVH